MSLYDCGLPYDSWTRWQHGGSRPFCLSAPGGMNARELADGAAFDARLGAVDAENSVLLGASCRHRFTFALLTRSRVRRSL